MCDWPGVRLTLFLRRPILCETQQYKAALLEKERQGRRGLLLIGYGTL